MHDVCTLIQLKYVNGTCTLSQSDNQVSEPVIFMTSYSTSSSKAIHRCAVCIKNLFLHNCDIKASMPIHVYYASLSSPSDCLCDCPFVKLCAFESEN